MNGRVLQNVEKYEKLLVSNPPKELQGDGLRRPTSTYLRTRDTYERLCQTQGSQVFINHSEHIHCIKKTLYMEGIMDKITQQPVCS